MSIQRIPSGHWRVVIPREAGSLKRVSIGTYTTKRDAEKAQAAALTDRDRGHDIAPGRLTVGELVKRFIDKREVLVLGPKTTVEYNKLRTSYVEGSTLGSMVIAKTKPLHVSEWVAHLLASGGKKGQALSPTTVRLAYRLVDSALRWGVKMELASRNVCSAVDAPSLPKTRARAFEADEIKKLLATAKATRWEHFIVLALSTGARRGELVALDWSDVDFEGRTVVVSKSMCQVAGKLPFVKGTKTGTVNTIPLSPQALDALKAQHRLQVSDRLAAKPGMYIGTETGAIFTKPIGERVSPTAASTAFAKIAIKAGLAVTKLHATRHSTATHALANGVDVVTVAALLGHSSPNITLSVYGHVLEGAKRAAVDRLGERFEAIRSSG